MDNNHHYKAAACEVKKDNRSLPKTFEPYSAPFVSKLCSLIEEPDCFKTEKVYAFNTP